MLIFVLSIFGGFKLQVFVGRVHRGDQELDGIGHALAEQGDVDQGAGLPAPR